jgi:hypothetical protein
MFCHAGTATHQTGHAIEQICFLATYGMDLLQLVGGDLAGWLGDLAPRGDLDSTQLLYRMCCLFGGLSDMHVRQEEKVEGAWLLANSLHKHLTPLIALACKTPASVRQTPSSMWPSSSPSSTAAPTPAGATVGASPAVAAPSAAAMGASSATGASNQRQPSLHFGSSPSPSPPTAAKARRVHQAQEELRSALDNSPACLGIIYNQAGSQPEVIHTVFKAVEARVRRATDQPGFLKERATAWYRQYAELHRDQLGDHVTLPDHEPLFKLLLNEGQVWTNSWQGNYSAEEEGRHTNRLQAYVQAAAHRAAGQLQQQPGLVQKLREALV